jgi:hypothetical protein
MLLLARKVGAQALIDRRMHELRAIVTGARGLAARLMQGAVASDCDQPSDR